MWPYPRIVAHRGGGTLAPENTIAAVRCGLNHGFRAVEFDVMLAADGVPIVMHDDKLGRTVEGEGSVGDLRAMELMAMDAGSWFSESFVGEPVPAFAQFAGFCIQNGVWMNIEIKPVPNAEEQTGWQVALAAWRLFDGQPDHRAAALPLLSSFSFEALEAAKLAAPQLPRALLVEQIPEDWHAKLLELGAVALHVDHRHLTPVLVRGVKEAGFGLLCYTVNDPQRATQLLNWGVDALCTDRLDLIGPNFASTVA